MVMTRLNAGASHNRAALGAKKPQMFFRPYSCEKLKLLGVLIDIGLSRAGMPEWPTKADVSLRRYLSRGMRGENRAHATSLNWSL